MDVWDETAKGNHAGGDSQERLACNAAGQIARRSVARINAGSTEKKERQVRFMDKQLLRSVMALNGDTNAALAAYLGITEQSVSNKINERGTEFRQSEICRIKDRYGLSCDMVDRIFFNSKVSNLDTEN